MGTTTLVTGAASGIGAAICRRLAAPGARLVMHTGTQHEKLERVATDCRERGAECVLMLGDLAQPDLAARLVDETVQRFGALDGLVANAGFADKRPLDALDDATLQRSLDVMINGTFRLVQAAQPHLAVSGRGRVVAISSFVAHVFRLGGIVFTASAAAKAGMEGLARSLAVQLAPRGITVNCVAPGYTQKDPGAHAAIDPEGWKRVVAQIPMGRLGQPDDVAAMVCHLLSPDAGYVTGQTIHVDGGLTL